MFQYRADNLNDAIQNEEMATLTSSLDGMEIFRPIMDTYEEGHTDYRARLFDYNDFDRNNLARIMFEEYCERTGIHIQKKIRFTADMYIYRLLVDSEEKYQQLEDFEGLYEIAQAFIQNVYIYNKDQIEIEFRIEDEIKKLMACLDRRLNETKELKKWIET